MMTTATQSALETMSALERKAEQARADASTLRREHVRKQGKYLELRQAKATHEQRNPGQYGADLRARKGTDAAKLDADIHGLGQVDLGQEVTAAERAQRRAENELGAYRFENAVEIARGMTEHSARLVDQLRSALQDAHAATSSYMALDSRYASFLGDLPGGIDGRDARGDERIDGLHRTLRHLIDDEIEATRSHSLVPDPALPSYVRYVLNEARSGYVGIEHVAQVEAV